MRELCIISAETLDIMRIFETHHRDCLPGPFERGSGLRFWVVAVWFACVGFAAQSLPDPWEEKEVKLGCPIFGAWMIACRHLYSMLLLSLRWVLQWWMRRCCRVYVSMVVVELAPCRWWGASSSHQGYAWWWKMKEWMHWWYLSNWRWAEICN